MPNINWKMENENYHRRVAISSAEPPAAAAPIGARTSRSRAGDAAVARHPHACAPEAAGPGPADSRTAADARRAEDGRARLRAIGRRIVRLACCRSGDRDAAPIAIDDDFARIAIAVVVVEPPGRPGGSAVVIMALNSGRRRSGDGSLSRLVNGFELRQPQHSHVDPLLLQLDQVIVDVVEFFLLSLVF